MKQAIPAKPSTTVQVSLAEKLDDIASHRVDAPRGIVESLSRAWCQRHSEIDGALIKGALSARCERKKADLLLALVRRYGND